MDELRRRSIAKGVSWRAFATLDTLILANLFTGSVHAAAAIGGLEVLTKIGWYYLHERLWLRVQPQALGKILGGLLAHGSSARSVLKAASWRLVGLIDTILISLVVTGKLATSASIGGSELVTKLVLYYLHERMWQAIPWGFIRALSQASHEPTLAQTLAAEWHVVKQALRAGGFFLLCVAFLAAMAVLTYLLRS